MDSIVRTVEFRYFEALSNHSALGEFFTSLRLYSVAPSSYPTDPRSPSATFSSPPAPVTPQDGLRAFEPPALHRPR